MIQRTLAMAGGILCVLAVSTLVLAQDAPQRPRFGQGGPGGGFGGFGGFGGAGRGVGDAALLLSEQVQKELELSEDQISQLRTATQRQGEGMRELFGELRDLEPEARRERVQKLLDERQAEVRKQVDNILLPHQRDRLRQIRVQVSLRTAGVASTLTSKDVAETLGLTPEQEERLKARAEEVQQELNEKIAQLREETRNKVLDTLTPAQRQQWEKLSGEPFELDTRNLFQGFGGGPGGPGGRGGFQRGGERRPASDGN